MFKYIKTLILGLIIFCVVFTFMPTGSSGNQVVSGFSQMSSSYGMEQSQMTSQFLQSLTGPGAQDAAKDYANGTLREQIVGRAVDIALNYGNGYIVPGVPESTYATADGKSIFYQSGSKHPCAAPVCDDRVYAYGTNKYWGESVQECTELIEAGHWHTFCHWSASYCWGYYLDPARLMGGDKCAEYYPTTYCVSSYAELCEKAQPGDMIHRIDNGNTTDCSGISHSFLWIGQWEAPTGEVLDHAIANTGSSNDYNDFVVKDFPESSYNYNAGASFWITPLDEQCADWVARGVFAYTDKFTGAESPATPDGGDGG